MATITVEGIPDGLLARLQVVADGSGRSLSREVVVQLARSVGCARASPTHCRVQTAARCTEPDCRCADRRVQALAVGWGGPGW